MDRAAREERRQGPRVHKPDREDQAYLVGPVKDKLGKLHMERVETKHVSDFLRPYLDDGKREMARKLRSYLVDLFDGAIVAGLLKHNPASVTAVPKPETRRARLFLDAFPKIYEAAKDMQPFVRRSMELAMVTGRRHEVFLAMEFHKRNESFGWLADGKLWVMQQKSRTKSA